MTISKQTRKLLNERLTMIERLRHEFGIEAARVILGHRSASVTEIYAEIDKEKALKVMESVG